MTMQQNISRIAAAKEDIRQAIIDKGVNVEATDLIGEYAGKIAQIQSTTPPTTETANYKVYVVSGGQEIEVSDAETAQDSQNALVLFYNNTKKVRYFSGGMEPTKMTPQGPVMGPQTEIELTTNSNYANSGVVFANAGVNVRIGGNYSILTLSNYVSNVIIDTTNKKILIQN